MLVRHRSLFSLCLKQTLVIMQHSSRRQHAPAKSQAEVDALDDHPQATRQEVSDLAHVPLPVLHEDADFIVVNKLHDVRMDGDFTVTMAKLLGVRHPLPSGRPHHHCHQLDFATSGALLYATRPEAAAAAQVLFERRQVHKSYLALVRGHVAWPPARNGVLCTQAVVDAGNAAAPPATQFQISIPIREDGEGGWHMTCVHESGEAPVRAEPSSHGKPAVTLVTVLARGTMHGQHVTKLLLQPTQGRRHQLRLHMEAIGCPIVGDASYGGEKELVSQRMCLHAWRLTVDLPWLVSGQLPRRSHKVVHAWARRREEEGRPLIPISVQGPDPFLPGEPLMDDLTLEATPVACNPA